MINLNTTVDYVHMLLVAAGMGAIGGLAAELLLNRADTTGALQVPHSVTDEDYLFELGFVSSLIIGAIAAVAILYFFPPVTTIVSPATSGKAASTSQQYDLVKLVALAMIVGSAGPAFLSTAQSRLQSALNEQKVSTAVETGKNQLQQIAASASAAIPGAVQAAVSQQVPGATADQIKAAAAAATASVDSALAPQVEVAKQQVDAIASPPRSGESGSADPGTPKPA